MKKRRFIGLLALGAAGFLMVSCGSLGGNGKWAASENSIYVTKELEIQSAMVLPQQRPMSCTTRRSWQRRREPGYRITMSPREQPRPRKTMMG